VNNKCPVCDNYTWGFRLETDDYVCTLCNYRITAEMLEASSYGLFQIHTSLLVPPGYAYIVNTSFLHQNMISQELAKKFIDDMFNEYKPKEKPFDYKKRAAIEFDLSNESGLR
jgi:hypothetical protein